MPHLDEHKDGNEDDDPVVASYDIYITDAKIRRILLQYPDRESDRLYNDGTYQKPTELRLKPETGLVEVDIPIDTITNYDERKGLRYGSALKRSNISHQGGTHGLAGGFNTSGSGGPGSRMKVEDAGSKVKIEGYADDEHELLGDEDGRDGVIMTQQTVGGRAREPTDGDPIYMLGAFKNNELHLAPLSSVVQLRPQLHHLDAYDEVSTRNKAQSRSKRDADDDEAGPGAEPEPRAIDMKVKSAEGDTANAAQGNNKILQKIQDEKWEKYEWVDENDPDSWQKYDEFMFNPSPGDSPQLQSAVKPDDYIDAMSAPRVDPVHPEMTGWAMKSRRKNVETAE